MDIKNISSSPKFITFEGGEGSGKSTQSKKLHEYLISKNIKSIHTREVGGTKEAEKIRDILVYSELFPISELMLIMSARYEHINKVIVPALNDGFWVICDRFVDSTACYQSGSSGLSIDDIYELHENLMKIDYNQNNSVIRKDAIMPDITFFMDVTPKMGLKRALSRSDTNKFEDKKLDFHQEIYNRFKSIALKYKERIVEVPCEGKGVLDIHKIIIDSLGIV